MSVLQESLQHQMSSRPVFELFQGYTISNVLAALDMVGILTELEEKGLAVGAVNRQGSINESLLKASLTYLVQRGLAEETSDVFKLSPLGKDVCRDKGYLVWLSGGYGETLRHLDSFLSGTMVYGNDVERNGRWVANGSALIGKQDVVPYAQRLLQHISFAHVLDLGCGNARFLLSVCQSFGCTGVGVDLSPEACAEASQAAKAIHLDSQVHIVHADAADIRSIPMLPKTDLVIAFFLLHEILAQGRSALVDYLSEMVSLLPKGAHLLVAEVAPPRAESTETQLFTPEFSLLHSIMQQSLLTEDAWGDLFLEAGLHTREVVPLNLPGGTLMLSQVPDS